MNQSDIIIDINLSLELANNKTDLAKELLILFVDTIPKELAAINQAFATKNFSDLKKMTHKFHGAICYCGMPRLKKTVHELENILKTGRYDAADDLVNQVNAESELALIEAKKILGYND